MVDPLLPGHSKVLQPSVTVDAPVQLAPPFCPSVSHVLVFVCTPPPQVTEQVPFIQSSHSQSTIFIAHKVHAYMSYIFNNRFIYFIIHF